MMRGIVYRLTALSSTALRLVALFPVLSPDGRCIVTRHLGIAIIWSSRGAITEGLTVALVGLRFVAVVGLAVFALPEVPEVLKGMVTSCMTMARSASWALAELAPPRCRQLGHRPSLWRLTAPG